MTVLGSYDQQGEADSTHSIMILVPLHEDYLHPDQEEQVLISPHTCGKNLGQLSQLLCSVITEEFLSLSLDGMTM